MVIFSVQFDDDFIQIKIAIITSNENSLYVHFGVLKLNLTVYYLKKETELMAKLVKQPGLFHAEHNRLEPLPVRYFWSVPFTLSSLYYQLSVRSIAHEDGQNKKIEATSYIYSKL